MRAACLVFPGERCKVPSRALVGAPRHSSRRILAASRRVRDRSRAGVSFGKTTFGMVPRRIPSACAKATAALRVVRSRRAVDREIFSFDIDVSRVFRWCFRNPPFILHLVYSAHDSRLISAAVLARQKGDKASIASASSYGFATSSALASA